MLRSLPPLTRIERQQRFEYSELKATIAEQATRQTRGALYQLLHGGTRENAASAWTADDGAFAAGTTDQPTGCVVTPGANSRLYDRS